MVFRHVKLATLVVSLLGALALGGTYWWEGDVDSDWDTYGNWYWSGAFTPNPYPSTTADDAHITPDGTGTVNLITEEIDDLSITRDVDFGSATGSAVTLIVDSLTIEGEVTVTLDGDATIEHG